MLLRNACALLGPRLSLAAQADMGESGGVFDRVAALGARPGARPEARPGEAVADCEGLLAIPAFVNAHTHVGDSIAKDAAPGRTVDESVHPVMGAKPRILARSRPGHLEAMMRAACMSMLAGGTTTFADFREGGRAGAEMLARAASGLPVRPVILGRIEAYEDVRRMGRPPARAAARGGGPLGLPRGRLSAEIAGLLEACDGVGLSGPNENSDGALRAYARAARRPKLRAIHAAETAASSSASRRHTGRTEAERALRLLRPHLLVHMTHAPGADLGAAARAGAAIVVCPRSNAALGAGLPDVPAMLAAGCRVALGTDNVMVNAPDMFREMDYLRRATAAADAGPAARPGRRRRRPRGPAPAGATRRPLDARAVLRMATVDGGRALRRKVGAIARGMAADCILIERHSVDLEPMHDPWAAVVHRASRSSIRAVVSGGRVVHGRI